MQKNAKHFQYNSYWYQIKHIQFCRVLIGSLAAHHVGLQTRTSSEAFGEARQKSFNHGNRFIESDSWSELLFSHGKSRTPIFSANVEVLGDVKLVEEIPKILISPQGVVDRQGCKIASLNLFHATCSSVILKVHKQTWHW